ncbi:MULTISPECIES: response regulator transcription factor [Comamonas]|jgi:DNA-binding response OmpR family regulator|uniref:response regulator transcription factor n=1 Tax=Comamonas TaxID=283 RepID=UPI0012C78E38|nr:MULTISPECIES: response regulator transcription factor [Comamonas]MEB5965710.1 response regulator transcription factor [Comamonas testosteroni]MPS96202.1 response regulator transcription factor [Comamonas sp.]
MRIAALDDDPLQLELLQQVATEAGHSCHSYLKGAALQLALRRESFDLLLVDWELPDSSGPDIVRWVREHISKEVPIIFVTHRSEEADIVEGLASGADDFMIKPIRAGELRARIAALLRRAYPLTVQSVLDFGPYRFLTTTNGIEMEGRPVEVTHREYTLALTLFQNQGRLLSRDHLREVVWGHNAEVQSRSLDTHVSRLRNLLNLRAGRPYAISAVYGYGYRLDAPETAEPATPAA